MMDGSHWGYWRIGMDGCCEDDGPPAKGRKIHFMFKIPLDLEIINIRKRLALWVGFLCVFRGLRVRPDSEDAISIQALWSR